MEIKKDIKYIGVNDHIIDLFEGQFSVPNGIAYNSYLILDEKTAVLDTVDAKFGNEWLENIYRAADGKYIDYLIIHHMEPDHSANIMKFLERYGNAKIVATEKAFAMMEQFFDADFSSRKIAVKDGDTLSLGKHTLSFITAPMVHWPEVMMSYDIKDKILFSADAFGKFGALDVDEDWACEARRYYFGIVGKYGSQVQAVLKKASGLEIQTICPLHGPVLTDTIPYVLDLYNKWSSYTPEEEGIVINYTSVYGNTKKAALLLAEKLEAFGCRSVAVNDLARCDMFEAIEDTFRYSKAVFVTTTYNNDIFPFMRTFLSGLVERNYQNRTVAFIENGSWAPTAAKTMANLLQPCKNLTFANTLVSIKSAMTNADEEKIEALAKELMNL